MVEPIVIFHGTYLFFIISRSVYLLFYSLPPPGEVWYGNCENDHDHEDDRYGASDKWSQITLRYNQGSPKLCFGYGPEYDAEDRGSKGSNPVIVNQNIVEYIIQAFPNVVPHEFYSEILIVRA